ncbi:hypothetical protein GCM10027053_03750 [Intrasporangium mesophilum]
MYELNRARLVGIGPSGARYTDVTIDLSDLGERIPSQSLLEPDTRRPSPFTLLMLENGGGKTVLLKLLFSVVLPGKRKTVGGASLEKFVLDRDTGHVALEWMHVKTGERLVTAKVYQRRTKTSSNTNALSEAWYSFRPGDTLDLGSLPTEREGRRVRLDGYKAALEDLNSACPATQLAWLGDDQGRWRKHLRERGIEPDLFDIQRSMNVDEGEAANAFKFASSKAFIDWLLRIVTDPEDATVVAESFDAWASMLAQRDDMILERDFLEGAIAGLEPLADAHRVEHEARRDAARAEREATALYGQLKARIGQDQASAAELEQVHGQALETVRARETERDNARILLNEVRLQTLRLQRADAETTRGDIQKSLNATDLEIAGWQLVDELTERDQARETAARLGAQVLEADEDAAPALRRRDEAAGALLAKLDDEARRADEEAGAEHEAEAKAVGEAKEAGDAQAKALGTAATLTERLAHTRKAIEAGAAQLEGAIRDGLIPTGTPAGEVADLSAQAVADHDRSQARLESAQSALTQAETASVTARREHTEADRAHTTAQQTVQRSGELLETALSSASALAQMPAVLAAAGGDPLSSAELDDAVERVQAALRDTVGEDNDHLGQLTSAQGEDARVLEALGDGRLLPPRPEVDAARKVLATAGIAAHPGWKYLNDAAPESQRAALIDAHPELADGVVLVDDAQLDRARQALTDARLLPAAAIAVGAGQNLLTLPAAVGTTFVIEPTPAMYDEAAAEERRLQLDARMQDRARSIETVTEQRNEALTAAADLTAYRRTYPPGRLTTLTERAGTDASAADEALQVLEAARDALETAEERIEASKGAVAEAAQAERARSDRSKDLKVLAEQLAKVAEAAASVDELTRNIKTARERADEHGRRQEELQGNARAHAQAAADARGRAERLRALTSEVVSTSGVRAPQVPTQSVPELQAALHAAQKTYEQMAVDPDLRARAEAASVRLRELDSALKQRDARHVAEARRLRDTPAGAEPASRAVALANARNRKDKLAADAQGAYTRVGQLEQAVAEAEPETGRRWVVLLPEWVPGSVQHGQELQERAAEESGHAQRDLDEATRDAATLKGRFEQAQRDVSAFNVAHLPLTSLLPRPDGDLPVAYPGTPEEATAAVETAIATLKSTRDKAEVAKADLAETIGQLTRFANENRFESLKSLVRRSIIESPADTLAGKSADWATELQKRLLTLSADLDNADRHRNTITDRLAALVDQALRTLRLAANLSELPAELAEWGGRKFLRIGFSHVDAVSIKVHVADVVDRTAREYATRGAQSRGSSPGRDGMALLLAAVHASVPKGFTVDVLKPDSVLREERVPIEEMSEVFSGGQELTAAIVLYCTLAALRANERGQMRAKHSGVLFLDNPIGRASAAYLLDLQQAVARALGVQLVYTTGLSDDRVTAAFPLWVRLRNDQDLRAGLKHIQVADIVRRALPEPFTAADTAAGLTVGTVTATRVYQRPAPAGDRAPAGAR